MVRTTGLWLSFFLGAGLINSLTFAEEGDPPLGAQEDGSTAISASDIKLSPISITATRNPIASFHYPGMVSVVDKEEIDRKQPSTVDDMVGKLPGVFFTGGPRRSGQVPSIRGFSGPDVVLLVDGVRQNFNSGHDGQLFLEPGLLGGAEVLRGSASSLYGSGGLGGVMEFRTLRAEDILEQNERFGWKNSVSYNSAWNEAAWTTTGVARPVENVDLVGSVTRRSSSTSQLGDGTRLRNTNDDILSGLLKGSFLFQEHHRLEASALIFNNDAKEPSNPQDLGKDKVDKTFQNQSYRLSYSYDNPENDWLNLDASLYHAENEVTGKRLDDLGTGSRGEKLQRRVRT